MTEILSKMSPHDFIGFTALVFVFGTGLVCGVTAIVAGNLRGYRERELAINLVRELAERGLPPDEIEHLLRVSGVNVPEALRSTTGPNGERSPSARSWANSPAS